MLSYFRTDKNDVRCQKSFLFVFRVLKPKKCEDHFKNGGCNFFDIKMYKLYNRGENVIKRFKKSANIVYYKIELVVLVSFIVLYIGYLMIV